jgi:hypothetical protein
MFLIGRPRPAAALDISILDASLWEARGPGAANVVLDNDVNGYLQITSLALVERSYVRLISTPAMTDGTLRCLMLVEGWDTTTTLHVAGAGVRLSWTSGNNMTGYGCVIIRQGAVSGDPFNWRMRELTAGTNVGIGSQSAAVPGGLLGVWSDIRLTVATAGANADVSCDCRREGQGSADYSNAVVGDTTPPAGTDYGIWINSLPTTHTVRLKLFEVS